MDKSIWVDYHRDEQGNPTTVKIDKDIKIVSPLHNTIYLQEVPDKNHGVVAVCDETKELPICDNLDELTVNNCYIDYLTGKVYFHQDYSGKPVIFNYYGKGIELLGASRVYDEHSLDGKTIRETLQDMIDKGRECIEVLLLFSDLAVMIKRIEKDIENATILSNTLRSEIDEAKPLQESLHQDIVDAKVFKDDLKKDVAEGKALQPVLQKTVDDATAINTTLNTSLDKAKPSIDLINSAGNPHYDIKVADWIANTDTNSTATYMFDIVHTLQTKYIQVNIDDTVNGLNILPDCRKIDNNTIRIFSSEKVDVTVTLSARYYDGGSAIADEVIIARGNFESLGKRLDNINSQLADITNDGTTQKRPLVVFISDDGSGKEYDLVAPIFESKGCVYTVATRADVIDSVGGITTNQLRDLISRGHSVCSHTWTHKDLATLSESEIRQQYSKSIELIETATQVKCKYLAYPFGSWNDSVLNIARDYFQCALATNMENYYVSDAVIDQFAIPRLSIIYNNGANQEQWSIITKYIDECYRKNGLLVFCTHAFEYDGNQSNIDYLKQTIDYIKSKGISIVNLDTAMAERSNIIDQGNFRGNYIKISKNGGMKSNNLDLYAIKKSNFPVDFNTDISTFEKNIITVSEILNDSNFPYSNSGQLLTYNVTGNYDLSFQLYYPALANHFYKRNYIKASGTWNSFVKVDSEKTAPIFKATSDIDVSSPPSFFTDGQITVGKAVNFPEASGTVTTYKINIANTAIYQIFQPANSKNLYKRKNIDSNTWDEWQCYSPCRHIGKFINAPTAFAGFYKTTQSIAEAKVGMTVAVSPNNGTCGDGVIWCAYIPADGQVEIRWYNFGASSVSMNTSWQITLIG